MQATTDNNSWCYKSRDNLISWDLTDTCLNAAHKTATRCQCHLAQWHVPAIHSFQRSANIITLRETWPTQPHWMYEFQQFEWRTRCGSRETVMNPANGEKYPCLTLAGNRECLLLSRKIKTRRGAAQKLSIFNPKNISWASYLFEKDIAEEGYLHIHMEIPRQMNTAATI